MAIEVQVFVNKYTKIFVSFVDLVHRMDLFNGYNVIRIGKFINFIRVKNNLFQIVWYFFPWIFEYYIQYLHLDTLTEILLTTNQFATFYSSAFTLGMRRSRLWSESRAQVSSANNRSLKISLALGRSFIKIKNKSGPRTLPCITEIFIVFFRRKFTIKIGRAHV